MLHYVMGPTSVTHASLWLNWDRHTLQRQQTARVTQDGRTDRMTVVDSVARMRRPPVYLRFELSVTHMCGLTCVCALARDSVDGGANQGEE